MTPVKKLKSVRLIERVLLWLAIWLAIIWMVLSELKMLNPPESYLGGGIFLLLVFIVFLIQKRVDHWATIVMAQTNIAQDEALYSLFAHSPVAYMIINTGGIISSINQAAINLLGGSRTALPGVNFYKSIMLDGPDTDVALIKSKVKAGMVVKDIEVSLKTVTGKTVWVLLSVYDYQSRKQRIVSLVDITEQKHIDVAKSEFVALATHQLRTPIAAIRWNVDLLHRKMKDTQTEDQARYFMKIERNVFKMIDLINDFLSVSKLEMGTFAATEEDVNLTKFFSDITDEFAEKFTEKQIELSRQDNPPQVVIRTDARLLHIVVSNLVSNAVKYLRPKGKLQLSYELKERQVEIKVADNGIGIPENEIGELFTKFFRASNAQSHQTQGTGLGLYVVKQSIELLKGNIRVASEENKGALFVVTIPASVVSDGEIG